MWRVGAITLLAVGAHAQGDSYGPCPRLPDVFRPMRTPNPPGVAAALSAVDKMLSDAVRRTHALHPLPSAHPLLLHCLQWTCTSKVAIDRLAITFFYQAAFTEQEAMERSISPLCYLVRAVRIDEHTLAHTSFAVCLTTLICRCWTTTCLGLW
jgi:hypothetical protein